MARKVPLDALASSISKILQEYGEDVTQRLDDVTQKLAKQGQKALRAESSGKFNGTRYAKGWTTTLEKNNLGITAVLHNKTPGLPHLLENDHAVRGGGRYSGRTHIAPVEEQLVNALLEAVQNDIP